MGVAIDIESLVARQAPDAISVHDLEGRYLWASPAFCDLLGLEDPAELTGSDAYERFHPDDVTAVQQSHEAIVNHTTTYTMQYRIRRNDSTYLWVETTARMVPDEEAIVSVTRPLTARQSELNALEAQRVYHERLQEIERQQRQFLTAVSHRARHPLTVARGMAELVAHYWEAMDDDRRELVVNRLLANVAVLDDLVDEITHAERLARGTREVQPWPVDLGRLVGDEIADVAGPEAPITATIPGRAMVFADPALLRVAVRVLLNNALAHTPVGTPIWLRHEQDHAGTVLIVEDAGPGIAPPQRDAIFEAFVRADSADADPGLGIGLHTVMEIAASHGGHAWVEDRPGGGASFRLRIPSIGAQIHGTAGDDVLDTRVAA